MRLGGPVFGEWPDPAEWVAAVKQHGYSACPCPLRDAADADAVEAYRLAAGEADLVIAEVGAWSDPLSPDQEKRQEALDLCRTRLDLADRIGARCCVNISGSRGDRWDGPHPDNLTRETFHLIVETVRGVIDDVQPTRTYYALETMPWMFPDSPDSYVALIRAVDRERFAVHLDPVNLVWSPRLYYKTGALIRECFEKLGPHIRSCHAKDVALADHLTVHLSEVRPGLGGLDYAAFLHGLDGLDPDTPLMLEHLPNAEEYRAGADHIRAVARSEGIEIR